VPVLARLRESPFAASLIVCTALALLSGAVLPTVPSYDPWSWIVWGREVSDPHLSFIVNGGPSWKPLPVMFTTVYGLFGGAAPTLWVMTERVGALMAFVAAYRLASMLCARIGYTRAAPVAGLVAAFSLILLQDFAYYFYRGASEPFLVGCALWAVDRLLAGKYWQAFWLGIALGLMRPEAWPFMVVFGAWLALSHQPTTRARVLVLGGLAFMPFAWFFPPGVSTGQWLLAATHASSYNGHLGSNRFIEVLRRGADDSSVPVLILAVLGLAITLVRDRDRDREPAAAGRFAWARRWGTGQMIVWITAGIVAWWVIVVGMTLDGYPGLERFYLPAAALTAVLAGVGVVRIGALLYELAGRIPAASSRSLPRFVGVAGSVAAIAIAYVFVNGRVSYSRAQYSLTNEAVKRLDQLSAAVAAVGGHNGVFPCKNLTLSYSAINHSVQTALAWKLHTTLERVGTRMSYPGVLFVGPHDSIDGGRATVNAHFTKQVLIAHVGPYSVYRVYNPADGSLSCVGR
jgi:hypothetical protein